MNVYIFKCSDGTYKIGKAETYAWKPVADTLEFEKMLHRKYSGFRAHHEFFNLTIEQVDEIVQKYCLSLFQFFQMKLEQIAPYLPFDLQIIHSRTNSDFTEIITANGEIVDYILSQKSAYDNYKLILKPLSCLFEDKEFFKEHFEKYLYNGFRLQYGIHPQFGIYFSQIDKINQTLAVPYSFYQELFRQKIDLFGLIANKLAVSY